MCLLYPADWIEIYLLWGAGGGWEKFVASGIGARVGWW